VIYMKDNIGSFLAAVLTGKEVALQDLPAEDIPVSVVLLHSNTIIGIVLHNVNCQ